MRAPTEVFSEAITTTPIDIDLGDANTRRTIVMDTFSAPYFVAFTALGEAPVLFKLTGAQAFEVPPYLATLTVRSASSDSFYYYFE